MDITCFLRESAKFMATDRPDIYPNESVAFDNLVRWFSDLAGEPAPASISSGGFTLAKCEDDGTIEYNLQRNILSFTIFPDEQVTSIFDWTTNSTLVDIGLDIPRD